MKILLATRNRDKVREMRAMLSTLPVTLFSAADRDDLPEVEEDADTLAGNAAKKSETLYKLTGMISVADDTGLEIDALDGAPGVYSSRFSGPNATYSDNVNKVLRDMQGVPAENRTARFRTVIAYTDAHGTVLLEGVCDGVITEKPQGSGNFGYDPIFFVPDAGKTMAEMALDEKNRISHRGKALQELVRFLKGKLS